MHLPTTLLPRRLLPALFAAALALVACDKTPPQRPTTEQPQAQSPADAASAGTTDASVPSAESVLQPGTAIKAEPDAGRSNRAMTRTQESAAMPLPGQNNDHSAPLSPAKGASAP